VGAVEGGGKEQRETIEAPWWGDGEFYAPGLARDGRTAFIPGASDFHRRFFLTRAAAIEPKLLSTLRKLAVDDAFGLALWATSWNLRDRWCVALARDTVHWYAQDADASGWEFEGIGTCAGWYPFFVKPLEIKPFRYDPTQCRRSAFKRWVLESVVRDVEKYCDQIETAATVAGLKRTPRKQAIEHFDWLARYQVRGESFASIAKTARYRFEGGRQTVRKPVVNLASYLELTLRASTSYACSRS
jgi:hypothetical protein